MKPAALISLCLVGTVAAAAALAPCLSGVEDLVLHPSGAVTLDGFILSRSPDSGLFPGIPREDGGAGVAFDVNNSDAGAVELLDEKSCVTTARQVLLQVVDPFDPDAGVQTFVVEAAP